MKFILAICKNKIYEILICVFVSLIIFHVYSSPPLIPKGIEARVNNLEGQHKNYAAHTEQLESFFNAKISLFDKILLQYKDRLDAADKLIAFLDEQGKVLSIDSDFLYKKVNIEESNSQDLLKYIESMQNEINLLKTEIKKIQEQKQEHSIVVRTVITKKCYCYQCPKN